MILSSKADLDTKFCTESKLKQHAKVKFLREAVFKQVNWKAISIHLLGS